MWDLCYNEIIYGSIDLLEKQDKEAVFVASADDIKIQDVFDMDFLQEFQDNFARSLGMTAVTVDAKGNPVTRPTDWTDFCMNYTRNSPVGKQRCMECDRKGGEESARSGRPAVYECHAGLMDFAAPIVLNGKQIGSILGGQVLTEPLNEDKFRSIAGEIGVDPEKYVEAVRKIKYIPKKNLEAAAQVLYLMANSFSQMGLYKYRLKEMSESINETITHVSATMEELAASAHEVNDNQQELNREIRNVDEISGKINEFTSLIKNIAKQTRLLGLNASIEAARAGTAGAGFSVVAEEIGKLADNSSQTVDKIQEFTGKINESVTETVAKGEVTSQIVDQQSAAINDAARDLTGLSDTAAQLFELAHHK